MKRTFHNIFAFLLVALGLLFQVKGSAEEHGSHASHTHGVAKLTVAVDNDVVEIEFRSPAVNLIGFEHQASTKLDFEEINRAKAILNQNNVMFSFSGGDCQLINHFVDVSSIIDKSQLKGHQPKRSKYSHQHDDNHTDVHATYHYSCENTSSLTSITVNVFTLFENIQQAQAFWINSSTQGVVLLNSKSNVINFQSL